MRALADFTGFHGASSSSSSSSSNSSSSSIVVIFIIMINTTIVIDIINITIIIIDFTGFHGALYVISCHEICRIVIYMTGYNSKFTRDESARRLHRLLRRPLHSVVFLPGASQADQST